MATTASFIGKFIEDARHSVTSAPRWQLANATLYMRLSYASPAVCSPAPSSEVSCPAPADERSWPPSGTGDAAHVGAANFYAGDKKRQKIDQVLRTFADSL